MSQVSVHVQVIDRESRVLPLTIPTYLTAHDLTTRVARDAGLQAYWPDGQRRAFHLHARGRVLGPEERLQDLGIVDDELLHLLPEPPPGAVEERPPAEPVEATLRPPWRRGVGIGLAALGLLAFAAADGLAVSVSRTAVTQGLGGLGIGLLSTSVSRRILGPPGHAYRIVGLAAVLALPLAGLAALGSLAADVDWMFRSLGWAAALAGSVVGVLVGWYAWHEPVEDLPES